MFWARRKTQLCKKIIMEIELLPLPLALAVVIMNNSFLSINPVCSPKSFLVSTSQSVETQQLLDWSTPKKQTE